MHIHVQFSLQSLTVVRDLPAQYYTIFVSIFFLLSMCIWDASLAAVLYCYHVRQEKHIYINTIMKPQWADECMTSNAVDLAKALQLAITVRCTVDGLSLSTCTELNITCDMPTNGSVCATGKKETLSLHRSVSMSLFWEWVNKNSSRATISSMSFFPATSNQSKQVYGSDRIQLTWTVTFQPASINRARSPPAYIYHQLFWFHLSSEKPLE